MKTKGVIIFLVIALMIATPMVSADNFLTGYSIFDKISDFFNNLNLFDKGEVGIYTVETPPEDGGGFDDTEEVVPDEVEGEQQPEEDRSGFGDTEEVPDEVEVEKAPEEGGIGDTEGFPEVEVKSPWEGICESDEECITFYNDIDAFCNDEGVCLIDGKYEGSDFGDTKGEQKPGDSDEEDTIPPSPTGLRYEIENENVILIWDNVLRENTNPTTAAITSYVIYEENFFNKITNYIKNIFKEGIVSLNPNQKKYIIYKVYEGNFYSTTVIEEKDYCNNEEICRYTLTNFEKGDRYFINSLFKDIESEDSLDWVGPIYFERITYTLTITPPNNGIINTIPNKRTFDEGESVTLTAEPFSDLYIFKKWMGSLRGTNNPRTIETLIQIFSFL